MASNSTPHTSPFSTAPAPLSLRSASIMLLVLVLAWSLVQNVIGLASQNGYYNPALLGEGVFGVIFLLHIATLALDAAGLWFLFRPRPAGYTVVLCKFAVAAIIIVLVASFPHGDIPVSSLWRWLMGFLSAEQQGIVARIPYLVYALLGAQMLWTIFLALLTYGDREYFLLAGEGGAVRRADYGGDTPFDRVLRQAAEQRAREAPFLERVLHPWLERLTDQSSALMQGVDIDATRVRLMRAGFPMGLRASTFVLVRYLMLVAGAIIFMAALPFLLSLIGLPLGAFTLLLSALIGAFYGYKFPDIWLNMRTRQRQFDVQLAMPDTMDLLTVSVQAGLGLYAGIQRVATRYKTPLSEELLRALQEVRLGRTHTEAMRDMAHRVDVDDLSSFVSAIVQAETLGIPIANVLTAQSKRLREKRAQRAREQAQKAPIKLIFPLVLFIFPSLFVVILGPAILRIMSSGM